MRLPAWIRERGRGEIRRIADASGVPYQTVLRLAHDRHCASYLNAKRISAATSGAVSIDELCKPPKRRPAMRRKRRRVARAA